MAKRNIIKIDENKCNGCGLCMPNCPEGAIQMIDGKARLVSDLFCDGLGACIGNCPEGAIRIEEREAEPYDEKKVMANIVKQGKNVIKAHLVHLKLHGEEALFKEAVGFLKDKGVEIPEPEKEKSACSGKSSFCPGSRVMEFKNNEKEPRSEEGERVSELRQWPVQLHLVPAHAPFFKGKDVVISADCVAYALADLHKNYLKGKSLAIACPKLDSGQEVYEEKLAALIDEAGINTLTVMTMEVPCCRGLLTMAEKAVRNAIRKIPLKSIVVSIQGDIVKEEWM
ncbi:MAG: 4Fe-4S binding protein [Candidatus Omnitrophota bacterium]